MSAAHMLATLIAQIEQLLTTEDDADPAGPVATLTWDERRCFADQLLTLAQRLHGSPPDSAPVTAVPPAGDRCLPPDSRLHDGRYERVQLAQQLLVSVQTLPLASTRARLVATSVAKLALALLTDDATVTRFVNMIELFRFPEETMGTTPLLPDSPLPPHWRYRHLVIPRASLETALRALTTEGWDLIQMETTETTFTLLLRMQALP